MNTFFRFFYEFISVFFDGIRKILDGIINGITKIFNYLEYKKILDSYKDSFGVLEWIFVALTVLLLVVIILGVLFLIWMRLRKYLRLRRQRLNQDELLDEIGNLNKKVRQLMKEKEELLAMKVSQLGLKPDEEGEATPEGENPEEQGEDAENAGNVRFPKLVRIDERMKGFKAKNYNGNFTLEELIDNFRCFAATQLHLYYNEPLLNLVQVKHR